MDDIHSRVTQYLRAVLKHTAAYRQFVDDPIDLARDQQHLLNPPTLRRDYVFRLAADLIEAILDLQNDIESDSQIEDSLNALDQARPDWRRPMPLAGACCTASTWIHRTYPSSPRRHIRLPSQGDSPETNRCAGSTFGSGYVVAK